MKLRYIFCALLSALLFTACTDDDEIGSLDSIQIDKTYVSIPVAGGDATITITASGAWQFDQVFNLGSKDEPNYQALPAWLKADVLSGANGESRVTFHADATEGGREAELQISAGGKKQFVIVRQGSLDPTEATIAEVLAGPAGPSYRVKGVISRWYSNYEQYGNYYLKDATGEIIVYGTADKDGKLKNYPIKSWGLDIGDEVTIEGGTSQYKGVNQFVDVTIIEVKKSLVKVESEAATIAKTGGEMEVKVSYKGNGVFFSIPEDCRSWLSYLDSKYISGDADTAVFRFLVSPNEANARSGQINFSSFKDDTKSEVSYTFSQLGGVADVSVADFLAAAEGEAQYRLTGVITELYTSDRQGKSFYIQDYSGKTLVYRAEGFIESGAKAGDVVTVVGKRGAYNGNPQMVSGQFERLDHVVTEVTIAEFLAKEPAADVYYRLTGTIESIANAVYGNVNLTDETGTVYVYGCYPGWGATGDFRKGLFEKLGIEAGDRLSVIGVRAEYNGAAQLSNGIYFSHEKAQ